MAHFTDYQFHHIPRSQNEKADALSRLALIESNEDIDVIYFETMTKPSIKSESVATIENESCWMDPIKAYLNEGQLPYDVGEARKLILKATRYTVIDGVLYKRSFTLPYLRCLSPVDVDYALKDIHEGICGQHLGGRALMHKILRQEFY